MDATQWLQEVRQATDWTTAQRGLFQLLEHIVTHSNQGFSQLGIDTAGKTSPPNPLEKLSVTANNGTVQAVLTHNAPVEKHTSYFLEASTDAAFSQPHVIALGASRSAFVPLPTTDANNSTIHWHFRAYAQRLGSDASAKTYFGDAVNPTPVTVGGNVKFTPLASTGSGTAAPNGQQAGTGLGPVQNRPEVGPKRSPAETIL